MSEPFLAEVRLFGFNFAPKGWAQCDGQILPINQNQSLYSLIGTTYGGDGRVTFALPDLRSRTPLHTGEASSGGGTTYQLGQRGGEEVHILKTGEIPVHTHQLQGTTAAGTSANPTDNLLGESPTAVGAVYSNPGTALDVQLGAGSIGVAGGNQGHQNMQPFLTVNFCIALKGLFPSQS